MAEMGKPRLKLPASVRPGEVFEIKTLIAHPMESGLRKDAAGNPIPRRIITRFTCTADGRLVLAMDLRQGVAANPYITFPCRLERSAELVFVWEDEGGLSWTVRQRVEVTPD
jgi:sulfur-oxidizing protein SoxZ